MRRMTDSKTTEGPTIQLNWLAMLKGEQSISTQEYPLYSDSHVTGEIEFGPYHFLHTVPIPSLGIAQPILVLRYDYYWIAPHPTWNKTDSDRYHGGTPAEEMAALTSLALGIRFRASDSTRDFQPGGDPKGRPRAWATRPAPVLTVSPLHHRWVLPRIVHGQHPITSLGPLETLPRLNAADAVTLVRSARLYQDALWLAESEPELAWLLMVSALETAAVRWRSQAEDPVEKFKTSKRGLYDYLSELPDKTVLERVAAEFSDSFGVTRKFLDFVNKFRPPAPEPAPKWWRLDWSDKGLENALKIVYGYRSKALHTGRPFPAPMCQPPYRQPDWEAWSEKPGGDMSIAGAVWKEKDIPMLLHTFEYIVRGTLLNWWRSL
jgi:hypothetical protein